MRKIITSLALTASLAAFTAAPATAASPVCHEDQSCWVWSKMGNLDRGVVTKAGNDIVVTPCQYRILRRNGRIDLRATPKLKGDHFALKNGCRPTLYA